ncbi:penicillin-binding transpeptidase domain-containing protein [Alkalibacter mobilis]|uniref:penicillin-binding transpeptidase domain-containing protein n=1 Tax=Alkalibacter mobilis TaxID=2787712 RepID=UPI00189E512E|nr:penicillin-binding transpeptidase domain-containing protein [Alkalibacter mobilis]MBF7097124.1 PASTA domain-containing protein [Alkalibacter mobilis]
MSLYHIRRKKRLLFAFFVFSILFVILAIKLTYIQAYRSIELTDAQINQLMGEIPITATRGDIYDRNMNILAQDASASSIYARPSSIEDPEITGLYLSEILELDKNEIVEKLKDETSSLVLIARKVDNDKAFMIEDKNIRGIEISEDKKRYYTNGNFASYVLGFTGTDHQGLYGIERIFDEDLRGEDGVLIYEKDGKNQRVPSGFQNTIPAIPGNHVVLTIDSIIQHFIESALEDVMTDLNPKRTIAIAMDPNTGEVLGMSVKPDYDLNDPRSVTDEIKIRLASELEGKSLGEQQQIMWNNPAVSLNYEPGSTFKVITGAAALEEGVVEPDTVFVDEGYIMVDGIRIRCHIYPRNHGEETFLQAISNSCNPVMVETIMRLNPQDFYKHVYNFGFGDRTGIQLDGEQYGIIPVNTNEKNVDYATKSFGQGISVTPIQLISALSAIVNDGNYIKPTIVKETISSETSEVIETYDRSVSRKVASEYTAMALQEAMENVVLGSDLLMSASDGYNMGGKTGTAQKIIDGAYAKGKYITSFFGFAPVDDPQIAILVIVDEAEKSYTSGSITGTSTAGIPAIEILKNSLKYLNVPVQSTETFSQTEIIPDLRNLDIETADEILTRLGIDYSIVGDSDEVGAVILNQDPMPGGILEDNTKISIQFSSSVSDDEGMVIVPNLLDMSIGKVSQILDSKGLELEIQGSGGFSIEQIPASGELVEAGSTIKVVFEHVE